MFKQNDKIVYPGYGVAVVEDIIEKTVGGDSITFFKLSFLYKDMTILVPAYNTKMIGIRYPSNEETINEALQELHKKPERQFESIDFMPSGWNRRQKNYQIKIQSGLFIEVVKIYRDIMYIAKQKELSFGERSLLQSIEDLIVQELQLIRETPKDDIVQELRSPFRMLIVGGTVEKNYVQDQSTPPSF